VAGVCSICCAISAPAAAQGAAPPAAPAVALPAPALAPNSGSSSSTPSTVTTSNDSNNYKDDRLDWSVAVEGSATPGGPLVYCIPAKTVVIGTKSTLDSSTNQMTPTPTGAANANSNSLNVSTQWQQVRLAEQGFPYFGHLRLPGDTLQFATPGDFAAGKDDGYVGAPMANGKLTDQGTAMCPGITDATKPTPGNVYEGQPFYVSDGDLQNLDERVGLEYGALVVPFKFQLSKGNALTGSASLGPYLGFRLPFFQTGIVISPVLFAGASTISVSTTSGSTTSSQNLAGLSYGGGLLFTIKDSFHVGVIVGADHVDTSANYQYNNKPWISFEIGYSFAQ
jgi:hypothetical protein